MLEFAEIKIPPHSHTTRTILIFLPKTAIPSQGYKDISPVNVPFSIYGCCEQTSRISVLFRTKIKITTILLLQLNVEKIPKNVLHILLLFKK